MIMMRHIPPGSALLAGVLLTMAAPEIAAASPKIKVGGYIRLDAQYEDGNTRDFPYPAIADTPFEDDEERSHGQFIIDARASRIRVDATDELVGVKVLGRIEADFYNGEASALTMNSRNFRLRHAFIQAEHVTGLFILAGQYDSLLGNSEVAQPTLVDFSGPAGQIFARQPQLRFGYIHKFPAEIGTLRFDGSMEKNSTDDLGSETIRESQGEGQTSPLYTVKIAWRGKPLNLEAGVAAAKSDVTLEGGRRIGTSVWAAQTSADFLLGPVSVFGHYHHNDGLGRLAYGDFRSIVLAGNKLENITTNAFYAGASWKIIDTTSVTGMFGWQRADELHEGGFTEDQLRQHRSVHVNVIHKFWQNWQVGLEYRRFEVEAFNNRVGHVNGALGAVWYFLK